MDNWNTIKKIIAIVLFIALLPITAFNVILVCLTFAWTQYLKTLIAAAMGTAGILAYVPWSSGGKTDNRAWHASCSLPLLRW